MNKRINHDGDDLDQILLHEWGHLKNNGFGIPIKEGAKKTGNIIERLRPAEHYYTNKVNIPQELKDILEESLA